VPSRPDPYLAERVGDALDAKRGDAKRGDAEAKAHRAPTQARTQAADEFP